LKEHGFTGCGKTQRELILKGRSFSFSYAGVSLLFFVITNRLQPGGICFFYFFLSLFSRAVKAV
jgi:hypothetical protein